MLVKEGEGVRWEKGGECVGECVGEGVRWRVGERWVSGG